MLGIGARFSVALSLVAAIALSPSAFAETGENLHGGRIVTRPTLVASIGYPDFDLGVKLPVGAVEFTPRVRFSYAVDNRPGWLDLQPALGLRWQVFDMGRVQGSVVAEVPVHLTWLSGTFTPGVGLLWPGFALSWEVQRIVDVDVGLQLQDDLLISGTHVAFGAKLPLWVAAEYRVIDGLQIAVRLEAGPSFGAWVPGYRTVGVYGRALVSLGYSF